MEIELNNLFVDVIFVELFLVFNGVISESGDIDCF